MHSIVCRKASKGAFARLQNAVRLTERKLRPRLSFMAVVDRGRVFRALAFSGSGSVYRYLFAPLLIAGATAQQVTLGSIIAVQTQDIGNKTNLVGVTLDDGRTAGPASGLVGIQVFHWNVTRATSGTSVTVLSPDEVASISVGTRADLLQKDFALNTGLMNPGGRGGIAKGIAPTASSFGLGVIFDTPVVNGPGDDVVLFDFTGFPSQSGDAFTVSALVGGAGYASLSQGFSSFGTTDYQFSGSVQATGAYVQGNPVSSRADLESKGLALTTTFSSGAYHAIGIDLSALHVADNDIVTGLFIQSTTLHPVFIGGFTPVPEPNPLLPLITALSLIIGQHLRGHYFQFRCAGRWALPDWCSTHKVRKHLGLRKMRAIS